MKQIKWLSEDRIIPCCGTAAKGQTKLLPDDIAESFVKQKMAEYTTESRISKPTEEKE